VSKNGLLRPSKEKWSGAFRERRSDSSSSSSDNEQSESSHDGMEIEQLQFGMYSNGKISGKGKFEGKSDITCEGTHADGKFEIEWFLRPEDEDLTIFCSGTVNNELT
jgi:hypothetical protein